MTQNVEPDHETLRRALDNEWKDHFQTRRQTWRMLEIAALLLVGFVLADERLDNVWAVTFLGVLTGCVAAAGVAVSLHHRKTQIRKFTHIDRLEQELGLHKSGLLDDVHPPPQPRWADVIDPRKMNTPLFILRTHLVMLIFLCVYLAARWTSR